MTNSKYLGVDIGGTKVQAGIVQNGEILRQVRFETSATAPRAQLLAELAQHLTPLLAAGVVGIGIGVPGLVDAENGIVHNVQNIPAWREVHLKQYLQSRFSKPVHLANDANAFAVGEKIYGQGQPYANLVGLVLGTGLGAGLILNHQLYAGTLSGAGEFGGMPYLDKTVEDYCSGKFFGRTGRPGAEWHALAQRGDAEALALFAEYGRHLGQAIHLILYALAPAAILLGGSVSQGFAFFQGGLHERLAAFPFRQVTERLVVRPSTIGNAAILGAAALCHRPPALPFYPPNALVL